MSHNVPDYRLIVKPYWGKPAVRNFRGGSGNVGIIRSPVRATALPDGFVRGVRPVRKSRCAWFGRTAHAEMVRWEAERERKAMSPGAEQLPR